MLEITPEQFEQLVGQGIDSLPERYITHLENVVITTEDLPTEAQRKELALRCNQTLFGLYEGVPMTRRGSNPSGMLPSKITVFRGPMLIASSDHHVLQQLIKHTLWHEIAHHFGLGHDRIHELERGL